MTPPSPNPPTPTNSEPDDRSGSDRSPLAAVLRRDAREGPPIAYRCDTPEHPRGTVLVFHGYGEHYRRYDHVTEAWNRHGLVVIRHDLRGHGESGGPRGHVDSFRDYLRDAQAVWDAVRAQRSLPGPFFLFGHSLGGLIAAHFCLEHQDEIRALLLSSPFLGLVFPIPTPVVDRVTDKLSPFVPRFRLPSGLTGSKLTHDKELIRRYDTDPLGFTHVTLRWVDQCRKAQDDFMNAAPHLRVPVFCLAAGDDKAADVTVTEAVFRRIGSRDTELRVLPGRFHEILNETDRAEHIETFAKTMVGWIER